MSDTLNVNVNEQTTPYLPMKDGRGNTVYIKKDSLDYYDYQSTLNILNPVSNSLSSTAGGYVDFDLTSASVNRVDNAFFTITIQNVNVADDLIMMPLPFVISRIELIANSNTVSTLYSQDLFLQTIRSDSETLFNRGISEGFEVDTVTGVLGPDTTAIAALGVRTYSLPIQSFLSQVFMPTLKTNNMRIRIYFNSGTALTVSTTTATFADISYLQPTLYLQGRVYGRKTLSRLYKEYVQFPHVSRIVLRRQQILPSQAMTGGSQYQQLLGALTGSYSTIRVSLIDSAITTSEINFAYRQIQSLSLIDSVGRPWGFQDMPDALLRQQVLPSKYDTLISAANYLYELPLSRSPLASFQSNRESGSRYMDGRWSLYIRAQSTGTYTVYINAQEYAALRQNVDGSLEVIQIKNDPEWMDM